ncbi:MAG: hypothetical protein ACRDQI_03675 [Pseudonocardiaceae bacterium]
MSTGVVAEQFQIAPAVSVGEQRQTQLVADAMGVIQLSPAGAAAQVPGGRLAEYTDGRTVTAGQGEQPVQGSNP